MATICLECGVKPCKRGAKKYCSRECSLKNTAVQKQEFDTSYKHDIIPWNKGISVRLSPKSEFKKGQVGYWTGRERMDIRGEWKERTVINCKFCGKERRLIPWEVRQKRKFCSAKCYQTWHRGENSPVFKGEEAVSRYRNRVAELPEYKEWRLAILKRDGYKCTICKCKHSKETPLEVDHKKRFLFVVQENNLKTVEDARNCKELWDTENGQTVCKPCHRTLDTYGTKGLSKLIT